MKVDVEFHKFSYTDKKVEVRVSFGFIFFVQPEEQLVIMEKNVNIY